MQQNVSVNHFEAILNRKTPTLHAESGQFWALFERLDWTDRDWDWKPMKEIGTGWDWDFSPWPKGRTGTSIRADKS